MVALLIGLVFIAFAIIACMPGLLGWWSEVLLVIKGSLPVLALIIGVISVFIGFADIKDRIEAKREQAEEKLASAKKE